MTRPRIIVTRRLPDAVEADLVARFDATLNTDDHQFGPAELASALREADIVLCTLTDPIDRRVFDDAQPIRARLLANFGVGFDHIDLDAARHAGVAVTNTPGVLTDDTADHALLLILAVARRLVDGERELRSGAWTGWRPTHLLGTRVSGRALGIVGFGRIGQAVARRAHFGLGMRVRYVSRRDAGPATDAATGASRAASLEHLLAESDFVSLHCPSTPETHHLINASTLRLMQRHAFLVNTSRGDVIDEPALAAALRHGVIAGAALDVHESEPMVHPELRSLPNVVLIPHLGSATRESRIAMGRRAVANIDAFVADQVLPDRIV